MPVRTNSSVWDNIRDMRVETKPVSALKPYTNNPRTHSKKQVRQIADSIKTFGWTNPILVDEEGGVIAGHGRLAAAKLLGIDQVPTLRLDHMTEAPKRAYIIADNKLAENAGWDRDLLSIELQGLLDMDLDFAITDIGFEMAEIDILIGEGTDASTDDLDELPDIDADAPVVSTLGDLWSLGKHRLLCADSTDVASFTTLMGSERARMVFTDPPYNVPIDGHVSGLGAVKHKDFAMASGEMSEAEFTAFLKRIFENLVAFSDNGSLHFVCMDWRHLYEVLTAGKGTYAELKNICVWNKSNGGMGSLYRSKHELICVFKQGTAPHINNVELGKFGRNRTNVWDYAGVNSFGTDRDEALAIHPTVKPVALIADAILDGSNRGDVVLDAFGGSGSTILAAEKTGRKGYALELDPKYVDATLRRYHQATGQNPVHVASGLTFTDLEKSKTETGEE